VVVVVVVDVVVVVVVVVRLGGSVNFSVVSAEGAEVLVFRVVEKGVVVVGALLVVSIGREDIAFIVVVNGFRVTD